MQPDGALLTAEKCGAEKSPSRLAGLIYLPAIFLLSTTHSPVALNIQRPSARTTNKAFDEDGHHLQLPLVLLRVSVAECSPLLAVFRKTSTVSLAFSFGLKLILT